MGNTGGGKRRKKWTIGKIIFILWGCGLVALPALAHLAPSSTFEGHDGDMTSNTEAGNLGRDWDDPPNAVSQSDLIQDPDDESFTGGSSEDDPVPTVGDGSIPPNKDDLFSFSVAFESIGGVDYMYLRWRRTNVLGTANMDFELNKSATKSSNGVTPVRTEGDVLINFDFEAGGRKPESLVLSYMTWLTDAADKGDCFARNDVPCWGRRVDLTSSGAANGAVNHDPVSDPISGGSAPAFTFGEAAINLQAAGLIQAGDCLPFASAFLKSRASTSFRSEMKDFIPPRALNFQRCGNIDILKVDDLDAGLANAKFNLYFGDPASGGCPGGDAGFSCTTSSSGVCTMIDVPLGDYCVLETITPPGHLTAPPQDADIPTPDGGATVRLRFVDPRLFRIITFTCRNSDNSLWPGTARPDGGAGIPTLNAAQATDAGFNQSDLCRLPAALFDNLTPGTHPIDVNIPSQ